MFRGASTQHGVVISLGDHVVPANGSAALHLRYTARLGRIGEGKGLYRSAPFSLPPGTVPGDTNASRAVMAVTQFEADGARHVFPCIDLPAAKAVFVLERLQVLPGMFAPHTAPHTAPHCTMDQVPVWARALFNTQPVPSTDTACLGTSRQCAVLSFAPTPRMSPYTLAIAVGAMDTARQGRWVGYAAPGRGGLLESPLRAADAALTWLEAYAGVTMPESLPTFQAVAVPGMTWCGVGMRRVSCTSITGPWRIGACCCLTSRAFCFRRCVLCVNMASSSRDQEDADAWDVYRMADVVCHEVTHQVFGNMVTCADWQQLTINEGLASFLEYECIAAVLPAIPAAAMRVRARPPTGALPGTHEGPLRQALTHQLPQLREAVVPAAGRASGGVVTYSKGAAVLAVVEQLLRFQGRRMQDGLRAFVARHAYGVATVDDLVAALLPDSNTSMHAVAWFTQPGLPLLVVDTNATVTSRVVEAHVPCSESLCTVANHLDVRAAPVYTPAAAATNVTWVGLHSGQHQVRRWVMQSWSMVVNVRRWSCRAPMQSTPTHPECTTWCTAALDKGPAS